jgi:hypothetical protein
MSAEVTARRIAIRDHGYLPIPLNGKRPLLKEWQNINADDATIRSWPRQRPSDTNTGALTKTMPVIDADILDAAAVDKIDALVRDRFADKGRILRRVGRAPKCAFLFKTDQPFEKKLLLLVAPGHSRPDKAKDVKHRIEILCAGQQVVVDGIHPDTGRSYEWTGGEPWNVDRADLPELTSADADAFLIAALAVLAPLGWSAWKVTKKTAEQRRSNQQGQDEVELNTAAVANYAAWVPEIWPQATETDSGGYRVTSAMLNRDLQEDIGFHYPDGIKDFGVADMGDDRDGSRTPISIVMEFLNRDFVSARAWLRERLGFPAEVIIQVKPGELSKIATRSEEVLLASGVPIYRRAGTLVRPIIEEVDASHGRKTKVARFAGLNTIYLRDLLNRIAKFYKYDGRSRKWQLIDPPHDVANTIMERVGEWTFPVIYGVISTPTMRPDGSLLTEPGYDPVTELLLVAPPPMPPIPEQPTKEDALAALALLEGLLTEFPLVDDVSQAVALSALITPVVRGAFPVTPMHTNRAPVASSGKSYLNDVVAVISTGKVMPVMAAGRSEEETEKRLGAALVTGQALISIDNVNGELSGDALCQAIERPVVDIRILGKTEQVRIEARGTSIFSTGNNIVLVGDICRRSITAVLDPRVEKPELREFSGDPVATVLADRGTYIAAALTICRAYVVAGRPNKAKRLASFEGWSDTVRSALIWLGKADCVASMDTTRDEDPDRASLREFLGEWARTIGVGKRYRMTVQKLINLSSETRSTATGPAMVWPELSAAVRAVGAGVRGQLDARRLGNWARSKKDRIIDGLKLMHKANSDGRSEWWVENLEGTEIAGISSDDGPF